MRYVWILLLAGFVGCGGGVAGNPDRQTPVPPPAPQPSVTPMSGIWTGSLNFSTTTGSLAVSLTQDSSGNITGNASSTPPYCQFTLAVTGKVFSDGEFSLQTADSSTFNLAGALSNGNTSGSGNISLGDGTGCGPRLGTFAITKQS